MSKKQSLVLSLQNKTKTNKNENKQNKKQKQKNPTTLKHQCEQTYISKYLSHEQLVLKIPQGHRSSIAITLEKSLVLLAKHAYFPLQL